MSADHPALHTATCHVHSRSSADLNDSYATEYRSDQGFSTGAGAGRDFAYSSSGSGAGDSSLAGGGGGNGDGYA